MDRTSNAGRGLFAAVLAALLLGRAPARAAGPDVSARIAGVERRAAGRSVALVELTVGNGWHVNAHLPTESFLVPTELRLRLAGGGALPVRYPDGELKRFAFWQKPLRVYAGKVVFEADLSLPGDGSGPVALEGDVSFQACSDSQCYPPGRIALSTALPAR